MATDETRNVLITGVSRGLGLETARGLLETGWTVYGVSRARSEGWEALEKEHPGRARFHAADLRKPDAAVEDLFASFVPYAVPLHGLVNNAAEAYDDLLTNLDLGRLESMFATNVFSAMALSRLAVRNMLYHQTRGALVHVSSVSVHIGFKGLSLYAASKGALEAFSKGLAREWGERGIRSNCVVPGFMETDMSAGLSAEDRARIYRRTALKSATDCVSVAAAVRFLLSDETASVTGQALRVDAGA
ncbi:MAG: SDR family oxidoreductase [Opitutales bacterium]|nr:SDR family oxidoreductase [Opitutales bacterium]